jgi:DNA replication ATP-dependent helicase Dna2
LIEEEDGQEQQSWVPETPEIAALLSLAEREHMVRRESHEAAFDRPVEERAASGLAVQGLRYEGRIEEDGRPVYSFSAAKNDSRLRPGARLRLSRGDARHAVGRLELISDSYDGKRYLFRLTGSVDEDALCMQDEWVIDEDVFDLLEAQTEILRCAERLGLSRWLAGDEPSSVEPYGDLESPLREGLEGSMREAFDRSRASRDWSAVQGPPGTGKTHLLARLALHLALRENARVLITAVSHQAIHNALGECLWVGRRMKDSVPGLSEFLADGIFKLGGSRGHNEGLPDGVRAIARLNARKRPCIAGATVYAAVQAATDLAVRTPPYDVVLFDEAGQAPLLLALGARMLGARTVFIGDDAQLPPVVELPQDDEGGDARARESVMSNIRRLYGEPFMLDRTRRLNAGLCSTVSDLFYGGRLEPTEEAAGRSLRLSSPPGPGFGPVLDPDEPLVFVDVPHQDCRSVSEKEALWAAALAREAARCGVPEEEVGVIAPYRAQCNRIRFLLEGTRTLCSTVDRFQGQEREMIVLSLTSSKPAYLARLAGFLFEPNRLNVAVSRARTKAVLLGSRKALLLAAESADADAPYADGLKTFLRLIERAHAVDGSKLPAAGLKSLQPKKEEPSGQGPVFEPGEKVEHPRYGLGLVLRRKVEPVDGSLEWVHDVRFEDGRTRSLIPRLCEPPMRRGNV